MDFGGARTLSTLEVAFSDSCVMYYVAKSGRAGWRRKAHSQGCQSSLKIDFSDQLGRLRYDKFLFESEKRPFENPLGQ